MSPDLFVTALQSLGLIALCTLGYGTIQRTIRNPLARRVAIGSMLGLGAALAMLQPFLAIDGMQFDSRNMFLAICTAFGGVLSTVIAATVTGLVRIWIGGPNVMPSLVMMVIICLLAGGWAWLTRNEAKRSALSWLVLGSILSAPMLLTMFLSGIAMPQVVMARVGSDLFTAFVFGKMFEGELRRAQRERQLNKAASTDALTGLPNRRALMEFVDELGEDERKGMALLIVDADHFKAINDSHGHDAGDQVLKSLAGALSRTIREGDFAARFGGEEFAVLLHVSQQADGYAVADRLRHALSQQHVIRGQKVTVTVSVGGTRLPSDSFDFATAFAKADAALYDAKRQGRDRAVFA